MKTIFLIFLVCSTALGLSDEEVDCYNFCKYNYIGNNTVGYRYREDQGCFCIEDLQKSRLNTGSEVKERLEEAENRYIENSDMLDESINFSIEDFSTTFVKVPEINEDKAKENSDE